jgi:hypothetical protein
MSSNNEKEALRIFRLLTPKHQADLLNMAYLAYVAENFVRKTAASGDTPFFKTQEFPVE